MYIHVNVCYIVCAYKYTYMYIYIYTKDAPELVPFGITCQPVAQLVGVCRTLASAVRCC